MYYALWDNQCGRMMCTGRNCTTKEDVKQQLWSYYEDPERTEIFLTDDASTLSLELLMEVGEFTLMESETPFPEDEDEYYCPNPFALSI